MAYEGQIAEMVRIHGAEGTLIDAYAARPLGAGPFPGVIVVHHMPGFDEWSREVTRRIAHHGYSAICPDLHFRMGAGTYAQKSQKIRESGGQVDALVIGDLKGGEAWLRELPTSNGKVGLIGFCSGGRVAYMASAKIPTLQAAVNCWGGNVTSPPMNANANQPVAPFEMTPDIKVPLLGIFGNEDKNPDKEQVNKIEEALKKHKKTYEFHRYDRAGHAIFNWEGDRYVYEAAKDGWQKVFAFYEKYLR